MFAIGDKEWPGISKLVEEAGELLQDLGKLIATGGKSEHWDNDPLPLKERIENELADLQAALIFVAKCYATKLRRYEIWHSQGEGNKSPRCSALFDRHGTDVRRCILMAGHDGEHKL